jgi:hypothetical protein
LLPVVVQVRAVPMVEPRVVEEPLPLMRLPVTQARRVRQVQQQRLVVVREVPVVGVAAQQAAAEVVEAPVILRAARRFVAKVQIHKNSPASPR